MKITTKPILIKAGSNRLGIGEHLLPPPLDCRLVVEELYQQMLQEKNELVECLEQAIYNTRLSTSFEDKYFIDKAKQLIKEATE